MRTVAWLVDLDDATLREAVTRVRQRLSGGAWVDAGSTTTGATTDSPVALRRADVVVVWTDRRLDDDTAALLAGPGARVLLCGATLPAGDDDAVLADAAGLVLGPATPAHDVRVRPGRDAGDGHRLTDHGHRPDDHAGRHEHVTDQVVVADEVADDVQVLLSARIGLTEQPLATWRPSTATGTLLLGRTAAAAAAPTTLRALARLLRVATDAPEPPAIGVGLLGYGAIGHEHSRAVRAVDGLRLTAVCDTAPERLTAAADAAPGVATVRDADELLTRDDVDLVVVSTPPSTHAAWALRALDAGKHVVVEKPFAIRTAEADEVLARADAAGLLAVVYQNRRYDPDHLAIRRLVRSGAIGEVFHVETFVGGYGHPCNLWHSDEQVSGGAFYDWGAHVLDQILDLLPTEIEHVTAATHKRRWFDVTNADHSRVTVRFADGVEAEFVHSDLAAALKPRWYVLGTLGAIVGHWRTERIVSRTDIGTLAEDVLAPADSPPLLEMHAGDGSITRVALPTPEPHAFHRELADRIRWGLPMSVTGAQSRRVLAVMEAARESAADHSRPVVPR